MPLPDPKAGDTPGNAPGASQATERSGGEEWSPSAGALGAKSQAQTAAGAMGQAGGNYTGNIGVTLSSAQPAAKTGSTIEYPNAYTSWWDRINGGGPGASGSTYKGGGIFSQAANFIRGGGLLGGLLGGGLGSFLQPDTRTHEERVSDWVAYEAENSDNGTPWLPEEEVPQATTVEPETTPYGGYVPPTPAPVEVPTMFAPTAPTPTTVPVFEPLNFALPTDFSLYGQHAPSTAALSYGISQESYMPQEGIGSLAGFADGGLVTGYQDGGGVAALSADDRDILIRTILGEAGGESPLGQAAVAHVLLNRAMSDRYPNSLSEVALQPYQFSTWLGAGRGGNDIPQTASPDDPMYQQVGQILDQVLAGAIPDPTGGATHYYSPAGMPNRAEPSWWESEVARGGGITEIGTHRFAGPGGEQGEINIQASERVSRDDTQPSRGGLLSGIFGGGGDSLGGDERRDERLARIQAMVADGRISQGTADIMAAEVLSAPDDRGGGWGVGLATISDYLQNTAPQYPSSLSANVLRGRGGSGTSAVRRLGARPLGTAGG